MSNRAATIEQFVKAWRSHVSELGALVLQVPIANSQAFNDAVTEYTAIADKANAMIEKIAVLAYPKDGV